MVNAVTTDSTMASAAVTATASEMPHAVVDVMDATRDEQLTEETGYSLDNNNGEILSGETKLSGLNPFNARYRQHLEPDRSVSTSDGMIASQGTGGTLSETENFTQSSNSSENDVLNVGPSSGPTGDVMDEDDNGPLMSQSTVHTNSSQLSTDSEITSETSLWPLLHVGSKGTRISPPIISMHDLNLKVVESQKSDIFCRRITYLLYRREKDVTNKNFILGENQLKTYTSEEKANYRAFAKACGYDKADSALNQYKISRKGSLMVDYKGTIVHVLPKILFEDVANTFHCMGHQSGAATWLRVCTQYWAPGLHTAVQKASSLCDKCQKRNIYAVKAPPLGNIAQGRFFNDVVAIDFLSIPGQYNKEHVLVIVDLFTRFTILVVTEDQTMESATEALHKYWIGYFSPMRVLTSDNGSHFSGSLMGKLCQHYGIVQKFTSSYNPRGNGIVERTNRAILEYLCKVMQGTPGEFYHLVPAIQMTLNSRRLSALGNLSPLEAMTGNLLAIPQPADEALLRYYNIGERLTYLQFLRNKLREIETERTDEMERLKMVKLLDTKTFEVGDWVLRKIPKGQTTKVQYTYDGPFEIIEKTSPDALTYKIKRLIRDNGENYNIIDPEIRLHISDLKPYKRDSKSNALATKNLH